MSSGPALAATVRASAQQWVTRFHGDDIHSQILKQAEGDDDTQTLALSFKKSSLLIRGHVPDLPAKLESQP